VRQGVQRDPNFLKDPRLTVANSQGKRSAGELHAVELGNRLVGRLAVLEPVEVFQRVRYCPHGGYQQESPRFRSPRKANPLRLPTISSLGVGQGVVLAQDADRENGSRRQKLDDVDFLKVGRDLQGEG